MIKSYITTLQGFTYWVKTLTGDKLSLDTETTDLNYFKLRMRGFSLCNGQKACYVNVWENEHRALILNALDYYLKTHKSFQKLIMHKAPFDLKVLHKENCRNITSQIFCTKTAAHLINENIPNGLKYLAERILKVTNVMTYEQAERYGYSSPEFIEYATNDAIWTWQLHGYFNKVLYQQKLDRLFYDFEMPFQFVLMDLAIHGVQIDANEIDRLTKLVGKDVSNMEFQLRDLAGIEYQTQGNLFTEEMEVLSGVNMRSPDDLVDIIQDRLGLTIEDYTKGNDKSPPKPSTDKASLLKLKGKHAFIDLLRKYKAAISMYCKFLKPFPNFYDTDGRVRTSFHNGVAVTGRLSSSKPNLQQLPKLNKEYPVDFRATIIAPKGKSLIVSDYGGQELRVLTQVTKDKGLIDAFQNDKDIHLETTNKSFNLNIPDECLYSKHPDHEKIKKENKTDRDKTKNCVVFPIIYGTTAYGVSQSLAVSEGVAQGYIDDFLDLYPGVREGIERCSTYLKMHKYVYTLSGRRRRLYDLTPKAFRQAFNFLIQGYSADMIRLAAVNVRNAGLTHPEWDMKIVLIVHDEIVVEVNDEYIEEAKAAVKEGMETAVSMCIPLVTEIGVGKRYSEAK